MLQTSRKRLHWGMRSMAVLGGLLASILITPAVQAEETPVTVPLSYIVNLSNWGPTTATGTAQVWLNDAEVRLVVDGLPLLSHQKYACWLVNQPNGRFLPVGRFNVSSNGSAVIDVSLQGSLPPEYNTVLITVQPDPDSSAITPSKQYTIAGFFPNNATIQKTVKHLPDTGPNAEHPPFENVIGQGQSHQHDWIIYGCLLLTIISVGVVMRRRVRLRQRSP